MADGEQVHSNSREKGLETIPIQDISRVDSRSDFSKRRRHSPGISDSGQTDSNKEKIDQPRKRRLTWNKGKQMGAVFREKCRERNLKLWKDPEYREKLSKAHKQSEKCKKALEKVWGLNRGKRAHNWKQITRTCLFCGKVFFVPPARGNAKFCCREHKCLYSRGKPGGRPRNRVTIICKNCGVSFEVRRARTMDKRKAVYCSKRCYSEDMKKWEPLNARIFHPTTIELLIMAKLIERGIYSFLYNFGNEICFPDFTLPLHGIIIECDGEYWHRSEETRQRDKQRTKELEAVGWRVLRFSEVDIKKNVEGCIREIESLMLRKFPIVINQNEQNGNQNRNLNRKDIREHCEDKKNEQKYCDGSFLVHFSSKKLEIGGI